MSLSNQRAQLSLVWDTPGLCFGRGQMLKRATTRSISPDPPDSNKD